MLKAMVIYGTAVGCWAPAQHPSLYEHTHFFNPEQRIRSDTEPTGVYSAFFFFNPKPCAKIQKKKTGFRELSGPSLSYE